MPQQELLHRVSLFSAAGLPLFVSLVVSKKMFSKLLETALSRLHSEKKPSQNLAWNLPCACLVLMLLRHMYETPCSCL